MNLIPRSSVFDFDSLFNDVFHGFGRPLANTGQNGALAGMRVDIHEDDKTFHILAELPGVKKKDISITLQDDILTVSAVKIAEDEKKEKGKVVWKERSTGAISRSFTVGPGIREKDIKAHFEDGVLTLDIPNKLGDQTVESARRIPIN